MPPILRFSSGKLTIPVWVLDEIEHTLDMQSAAPRADVLKAADADATAPVVQVHDLLHAHEVDHVQRLRGWNRAKRGTIVVDAHHLSLVRNVLDGLTDQMHECEDYLDDLLSEFDGGGDPDAEWHQAWVDELTVTIAFVEKAVDAGLVCGQCDSCKVIALRDILDELMNDAHLPGGSYYEAYKDLLSSGSAIEFWRTRVNVSLEEMRTAA